ncbi:MAG: methylenetetrahydrofolate reductase [Rhodobacteraceae bacterium]|nr:MAG: methylenetetrahydrofolate reductase [Paracoccaceae bacterium]
MSRGGETMTYATHGLTGADLLKGYSIEVMPRTAAKIEDFKALLPAGTRVYIAHIDGTPIADMVATAGRLRRDGFEVMPHFPARSIPDLATLKDWISRYQGEAGVDQALVLAGGNARPVGDFGSSIELLQSGAFHQAGFRRLHVAGHPEGNRDIDPDGSTRQADAALRWKAEHAKTTGVEMAIVTQFLFDADRAADWMAGLRREGIELPVHLGLAGPAKLQTLIKFAIACGVGPSLSVLKKRARDLSKLLVPFEPDTILDDLARRAQADPTVLPAQIHLFPLGGIAASAEWASRQGAGHLRRVVG